MTRDGPVRTVDGMVTILPRTGRTTAASDTALADRTPPVLACTDLWMSFHDRPAVAGLSFAVHAGEAYGLVGPNGAGKTTTIRMVCGILAPEAGAATVGGRSLVGPGGRAARGQLGYVPQGLALFPTLTLAENLAFWAKLGGLARRQRSARIAEVLDAVGLADRARDRVEQCSGGMQRRLNLAIALLGRPRLLVLDEPTVGVDPQSRAALLDGLAALRDGGTAILYTSHYMEEVERLCDRVGIMDHGRLLAEGTPADLVALHDCVFDLEGVFLRLTGRDLRD
jgi:ABC-2 type transport system ATP-binding protein